MEDQEDYKERFKRLTTSLHRSLECPVCLDTLKDQFKSCSRGHAVCFDCCLNLRSCPSCDTPLSLENLICMKNVLEISPKFCRYNDAGCGEIVDPGGDHETFCAFRPINCITNGCDQEMCIKDLKSHMENAHIDHWIVTKEFSTWTGYWESNLVYRSPVFLFNNLFWLIEKIDEASGYLYIMFGKTPIGKSSCDCYLKVKVSHSKVSYVHTLKACMMNDLNGSAPDEITEGFHCLKISIQELTHFKNVKGEIKLNYNFFQRDNTYEIESPELIIHSF